MNELGIYPGNSWEDDYIEGTMEYYQRLRACFLDAAQKGNALLVFVT